MIYGSKPTDGGHFFLDNEEYERLKQAEPAAVQLIRPFMGAHEYLHGEKRWVFWFVDVPPAALKASPTAMTRVRAVSEFRKASKAESTRSYAYPTLFRQVTQPRTDYVLIPGHTSENRTYIPFGFLSAEVIVGNSCFSIPSASLAHFGALCSAMHMAWVRSVCGRLKSDFRYSKDIVYNNFPWPEPLGDKARSAIEAAAQAVLDARAAFPDSTLADLYDPLSMPPALMKAHQQLDRAVDAAYTAVEKAAGRKAPKLSTDAERVAFLFERYLALTSLLPAEKPKRAKKRIPAARTTMNADGEA